MEAAQRLISTRKGTLLLSVLAAAVAGGLILVYVDRYRNSVKAEGEDHSGTNNANMSTPADGSRPRMQMYRFTGNSANPLAVQRDSSTDWGIVARPCHITSESE